MPVFSKVAQADNAGFNRGGVSTTQAAQHVLVSGKELAFQFMGQEHIQVGDVSTPVIACLCGQACNFRATQQGARTKEAFMVRCTTCQFRLPGSALELLTQAMERNLMAFKIRFCPISSRPMIYVTSFSAGQFIVKCSYERCGCTAVPLAELLAPMSDVTILTDECLQYLSHRGHSVMLQIKGSDRCDLETFEEALKNVTFFGPSTKAKKGKKETDAEDEDEEEKPKKKIIKKVPTKTALKKLTTVKKAKPAVPKKKTVVSREYIEEEAEEASGSSEVEEDVDIVEDE